MDIIISPNICELMNNLSAESRGLKQSFVSGYSLAYSVFRDGIHYSMRIQGLSEADLLRRSLQTYLRPGIGICR